MFRVCPEHSYAGQLSVVSSIAQSDHIVFKSLGDPYILRQAFKLWSHKDNMHWTLHDMQHPDLQEPACSQFVSLLVNNASWSSRLTDSWMQVGECYHPHMHALQLVGLAEVRVHNDISRCALNDEVRKSRTLYSYVGLTAPQPALSLACRSDLAIKDQTSYELICSLLGKNWEWKPWVRQGKRKRADDEPSSLDYKLGGDLVFCSSPAPILPINKSYLQVLHTAED